MRLTVGMCPALTDEVLSKLKNAGIRNIMDFMLKDSEALAMETSDLQSIRRIIHAHYAAFAVPGDDLLGEAVRSAVVISTGNTNLDSLLGGGIMTGEMMEICGSWSAGKTSLCVNLAVHAALKLGLSTLYVDPLINISPLRLNHVVEALSEEEEVVEQALARIKVVTPSDVWGIFQALDLVRQPYFSVMGKNADSGAGGGANPMTGGGKIKLVIVDSLPSVLTPLLGRSQSQGRGIISHLATTLKSLASEQQLAVVVVNNVVQADFSSMKSHGDEPHSRWKPGLGRFWAHVPNTRLFIEREDNSSTLPDCQSNNPKPLNVNVTIWKSTRLKMANTKFSIFSS
ncbi:DNA repair protein RAD51 homolog 4-like isoform X2 [Panulirus ornatus]|uniref:DNA repair protein RAD51 homolog 4-like isoform X2 n=1 Tax=Panulirus ornatus TaxID=150431 RepID=UPI003A873D6C